MYTEETIPYDLELDVRGLRRPLPVINTKKSIGALEPGKVVKVLANAGDAIKDFHALAQVSGLELLATQELNGELHLFIRKPKHAADHYDREVDARKLSCPLPILNTRQSIANLADGEVIKVISSDRGSLSFFESLTRQTELELLSWQEREGEYQFFLKKSPRWLSSV